MATIGTFKKTASNEYTGDIVTLSVQAKNVRIVPDLRASGENAPSHRVLVGRAEIGAAWSKRSNEGRDYLGLKLDDPSFNAPIYANLFDDEDSDIFSLIWSRPNGRRSDCGGQRAPAERPGPPPHCYRIIPVIKRQCASCSGPSQCLFLVTFRSRTTILVVVLECVQATVGGDHA